MMYCFLGEDTLAKDAKISEIKEKYLNSADSFSFDWEVLHANKLDPANLKKSLTTLPVLAAKRVVLIRLAEKLSAPNKDLILEFIKQKRDDVILILDAHELPGEDRFWESIKPVAKVVVCSHQVKANVFDMTKAMGINDQKEALRILDSLLQEGQHPLQIMGVLVWFWGRSKAKLRGDNFKKGLFVLQEADLNIKRSRLNPEYAIETAVVKLMNIS